MKKKDLILLYLFVIGSMLYADPKYLGNKYLHTDEPFTVQIFTDKIDIDGTIEYGKLKTNSRFDTFMGDNSSYIILNCNVQKTYFVYLVKNINDAKYTYSSWEITYCYSEKGSNYDWVKLVPFKVIGAESYIIEKDKNGKEIKFIPENHILFDLGSNPWAVSKDNKKEIHLNTDRFRNNGIQYYPINEIVFVNGFVYPDKDYLYDQNARAKRIKITYGECAFETELKDTGNFQVIQLPVQINPVEKNDIKIEILDSYPGTKYSDVVISGVYYLDAIMK